MYFSLRMGRRIKQQPHIAALGTVWEAYRMTHMFPEQEGAATRNLFKHLVEVLEHHDERVAKLERLAIRARRKVGPRGSE